MSAGKETGGNVGTLADRPSFLTKVVRNRTLLLMCLPAIAFFIMFSYVPMPGVWVAFVKYNYRDGIFGSKFVGLNNFKFIAESGKLWELTKNTVLYNIVFILLGNFMSIFMAILLNELQHKYFKKISQTMMLLPYFISQVLVGFLVFCLLNDDTGLFGRGHGFYMNPNVWPFFIVFVNLWQGSGYNSIVYFASIMGIDSDVMEAAKIDGANSFERIRYIILPLLKPTIIILLLFALGGIVKGNFGLFFNLVGTNSVLYPTTDIIETYVYRATLTDFNFSTASAIGLYQSIIGFLMVLASNWVVKKIDPEYSLF